MALLQRVRTTWSGAVVGGLSTFYYGPTPGAVTTADIQACVDRVRDFWTALNAHIINGSTWTVNGVVDVINDVDGSLFDSHSVVARTGTTTLAGDPLPAQTQGLVAWVTTTIVDGHRLRGHTFIPAPVEVSNTAGAPIAAYTTALGTAAAAALVNGTMNLQIWHRPRKATPTKPARVGASGPVTGGSGKGTWAVLRSRR